MYFVTMFRDILTHQIFLSGALAWTMAQTLKMVFYYRKFHRLNFRLLVGTGGMPSSHSALVCGMCAMTGLKEGWGSSVFMVALTITVVVIADAAGFRRATGKQAVMLNQLADDFYAGKRIKQDRLWELMGHTPLEVVAGAVLGIVTAVTIHSLPGMM